VLLASGRGDGNDPDQTAKCILGAFVTPVEVHGQQLFVTCSIGLAVYREGGTESDELLENAYAALQKAKAHGGNSMSAYSHSSSTRDIERLPLEAALRRAPERSELLVFYQPQVDVRTGEIVGAEALLRWHPPHKREVSPARFIPIAEETGLIIPIGEWVLRAACCRIKAWRRPGSPLKRIAVNLSARQFRDTDLAKFLAGLLKEFDIDPACLELELTESMLIEDIESAIQTMKELKVLGVHMALDDFGTGHSSLSYLRRFPIETLKIDQSFIREIAVDKTSVAVSEGIVTLARLLGLNVVAEGVETESQLTILQSIGCNVCQGHLFSKPLSAEKFNALLAERPSQDSNANKYVG
jgi:EAL domain-containing protein (putative c-di-GMP-specific phosphodiesterase class I)